MKRRLLWGTRIALVASLVLWAAAWSWDHRQYWFTNNFRTVEPDRIYAGGYQYPIPLARIVRKYHIKTVLCLREAGDPADDQEQAVLVKSGVEFRRVVVPHKVSFQERLAKVEEAVAILADSQSQPVFVHCWAGCHRTGVVVAAYRVRHCGWGEQAAATELKQWGGDKQGEVWPFTFLHEYCSMDPTMRESASHSNSEAKVPSLKRGSPNSRL